jgi:hypothetical protein
VIKHKAVFFQIVGCDISAIFVFESCATKHLFEFPSRQLERCGAPKVKQPPTVQHMECGDDVEASGSGKDLVED